MLRGMTAKQLLEWETFAELEPFDERRQDWRTATILAMLANVNRDPEKRSEPYTPKDFLPLFGDDKLESSPGKSWQEQKAIMDAYAGVL